MKDEADLEIRRREASKELPLRIRVERFPGFVLDDHRTVDEHGHSLVRQRFTATVYHHRGPGACWLACGNLEHAAEDRVIVLMPLGSFRCRPVSVVCSFPFPSVAQDSGTQAQRCQRRAQLAAFPGIP